MPGGSKKLVPVRQDLVDAVYDIAREEGKAPYDLINDIFNQTLRVHKMGKDLREIVDAYELIETEKGSGSVIIGSDILYYMINKLYPTEMDKIGKMYFERGRWYGNYLSAKFFGSETSGDPLESVVNMLRFSLWDVSTIDFKRKGDEITLSCIAPHLSEEGTEVLTQYLKGVFSALGYEAKAENVNKGIIMITFSSVGPQGGGSPRLLR